VSDCESRTVAGSRKREVGRGGRRGRDERRDEVRMKVDGEMRRKMSGF